VQSPQQAQQPHTTATDPLGISVTTMYAQPASEKTHRSSLGALFASASSSAASSNQTSTDSQQTQIHRRVNGASALSLTVCVEQPNETINSFNGTVTHSAPVNSRGQQSASSHQTSSLTPTNSQHGSFADSPAAASKNYQTHTLTRDNLLLRGSILRATEWCVCMVVYTGKSTKVALNNKHTPSKLSSVDRIVNKCLLIAIMSMLIVCLLSMVLSILWVDTNKDADYLCLKTDSLTDSGYDKNANDPNAEGSNGQTSGCVSGSTESVLTVFTFATLYNNFVCISMYVSLEMVYLCQSYFISTDMTLYDETTDTPAECHSSGMCADLGQIQYVMSDKTGTLTKNEMKLRRLSVAGIKYGAPVSLHTNSSNQQQANSNAQANTHGLAPAVSSSTSRQSINLLRDLHNPAATSRPSIQSTTSRYSLTRGHVQTNVAGRGQGNSQEGATFEEFWEPLYLLGTPSVHANTQQTNGAASTQSNTQSQAETQSVASTTAYAPSNASHTYADNQSVAAERNRVINDFVRVCVCCNTCILMPDDRGQTDIYDMATLKKHLQAESPDEVALVLAAAEHTRTLLARREGNCMFVRQLPMSTEQADTVQEANTHLAGDAQLETGSQSRTQNAHQVEVREEMVEVMAVNEFDSDRKRMSVLVKLRNSAQHQAVNTQDQYRYVLLVKGADSSVLPLCNIDNTQALLLSPSSTPAHPQQQQLQQQSSSASLSSHSQNWALDTVDHIELFASTGLRTLVCAQKFLTAEQAAAFVDTHKQASMQTARRQEMLSQAAIGIEKDLELLGAVGVEDELQEGVPEAISMLLSAGLNVWMITGDKPETAVAISQQCGLLTDEHEVEKVLSLSGEALRQRILDLHSYLEGYRQSFLSGAGHSSVSEGRDQYSFSIAADGSGGNNAQSSSGGGGNKQTNALSSGSSRFQQGGGVGGIISRHAHTESGADMRGHLDNTDYDENSLSNHSMQNMLQASMLGAHTHQSRASTNTFTGPSGTPSTAKQTKYIAAVSRPGSMPYANAEEVNTHIIEKV
jgi:magnesium-transporting ATPase (P-type)